MLNIYSKTLFLRRGALLKILINYDCNLDCPYCNLKLVTGARPRCQTSSIDQWLEFIDRFPVRIKEVTIEGGEPTLYPKVENLVNALLKRGLHVRFYTNLMDIDSLEEVRRSCRFRIIASNHR
jgi:MoaA/NifB/PqqE/SkfB family radical SAM enzyme